MQNKNSASDTLSKVRDRVSVLEWRARLDCAATYRLIAKFGLNDLIYNHITVRISQDESGPERFLINPFGYLYEEITASSLISVDIEGNIIFNPHLDFGINQAGYVIHSAIHASRHDVGCIIHTHTASGMAVSSMECGLLPLSQTAIRCFPVAVHEYEGPAIDISERARLSEDLGTASCMLLRNHGLLAVGTTAAEAFNAMYCFELACKVQVNAMAAQATLHIPSADVIEKTQNLYKPGTRRPFGVMEWPSMLRYIDREDSSWRS